MNDGLTDVSAMSDEPDLDLPRILKTLRDKRGWSQEELARRAGLSSVAMIESGERKKPRYSTVLALARAFGLSVEEMVGERYVAPAPMENEALDLFLDTKAPKDIQDEEVTYLRSAGRIDAGARSVCRHPWRLLCDVRRQAAVRTRGARLL